MIVSALLWVLTGSAVAGTSVGTPPPATVASSSPTVVASLGNMTGKTNVLKTGSLTTIAKTASQVVLTYTVTNGKYLYLQGGNIVVAVGQDGVIQVDGEFAPLHDKI